MSDYELNLSRLVLLFNSTFTLHVKVVYSLEDVG